MTTWTNSLSELFKHENEEVLAGEVLRIAATVVTDRDARIIRRLWADRQYMAVRLKIVAMALESEDRGDGNSRKTIARWAREAFEEVGRYDDE